MQWTNKLIFSAVLRVASALQPLRSNRLHHTLAQWQLIEEQTMSVSAAPRGPSALGRNTSYVFPLPAL
jgi:hypothetical protein